ncbi:KRUF family protein, partial [Toxoplasma gondii GAB2-2007-GAL-DOM2]
MATSLTPNPPKILVGQWRRDGRRSFVKHASRRRERAATLRAQADMWEGRLAS